MTWCTAEDINPRASKQNRTQKNNIRVSGLHGTVCWALILSLLSKEQFIYTGASFDFISGFNDVEFQSIPAPRFNSLSLWGNFKGTRPQRHSPTKATRMLKLRENLLNGSARRGDSRVVNELGSRNRSTAWRLWGAFLSGSDLRVTHIMPLSHSKAL